jgi:hypothetical protein
VARLEIAGARSSWGSRKEHSKPKNYLHESIIDLTFFFKCHDGDAENWTVRIITGRVKVMCVAGEDNVQK